MQVKIAKTIPGGEDFLTKQLKELPPLEEKKEADRLTDLANLLLDEE